MAVNALSYYRKEFTAMGTRCEIQLFANSQTAAQLAIQQAITDVQRLEARYSRYKNDSFLSAINQAAAVGGSIDVDDETAGLLDYAQTCHQQSDGLFDISSGILRRAWKFELGQLPEQAVLDGLLNKVGWHKVRWLKPKLHFTVPGMELDFGGVVKEYAVDRAAALCQSVGIRHGVINLGGDIKVIGPRADGSPWHIGIRDPANKDGLLDTLLMSEGALASSGDYERCITINGIRYGHILNPKTGWPVHHLAAVSVIADFCVVAGSAATIAMLKETEGIAWLQDLGLPHLWVDVQGKVGGAK
ncbi:MAG: FAD:protein FMN transferase [Methylococcales bacterium]|nr:FAD:protein FMN transferase [Methylococcales bacterium]